MYLGESTSGGFWGTVGSIGRAVLPTLTSVGGQLYGGKMAAEAQADAAKKEQRTQLLAQAAQRKAEKKAERFAIAQEQARAAARAINPVYIAGGISAVAIAGGAWWYIATRKKKKAKA
jgi:hypothetical protein